MERNDREHRQGRSYYAEEEGAMGKRGRSHCAERERATNRRGRGRSDQQNRKKRIGELTRQERLIRRITRESQGNTSKMKGGKRM
jgi:hypothetical protein